MLLVFHASLDAHYTQSILPSGRRPNRWCKISMREGTTNGPLVLRMRIRWSANRMSKPPRSMRKVPKTKRTRPVEDNNSCVTLAEFAFIAVTLNVSKRESDFCMLLHGTNGNAWHGITEKIAKNIQIPPVQFGSFAGALGDFLIDNRTRYAGRGAEKLQSFCTLLRFFVPLPFAEFLHGPHFLVVLKFAAKKAGSHFRARKKQKYHHAAPR